MKFMKLPINNLCLIYIILVFTSSIVLSGCSNREIPLDGAMSDAVTTMNETTLGESTTSLVDTSETITTTTPTQDVSSSSSDTVGTDVDNDTTSESLATSETESESESESETETTTTSNSELFGYTVEEVTSIAKDLYSKACSTYRSTLIEGAYSIDFNSSVTDQYGKRYYRIDDANCPSMDTVYEDWHKVFTDAYDSLISTTYVMYDGSIYSYVAIQQENTNYDSTTLVYYYPTGNYELTFKATSHYSSGDKVFKFSITYDPDTQEWRVSKFTMPY